MGIPPQSDHVLDPHLEARAGLLRQVRTTLGSRRTSQLAKPEASQEDVPSGRGEDARQHPDQRRLASPIRTEQHGHRP